MKPARYRSSEVCIYRLVLFASTFRAYISVGGTYIAMLRLRMARAVAAPVLRHRIMTNFNAEAEGIKPDDIVRNLIDIIPPAEEETALSGRLSEVFRPKHAG